jgi:hypothetical protein
MTCGSSEPVATVGARPTPVRVRSDTEPQTEVSRACTARVPILLGAGDEQVRQVKECEAVAGPAQPPCSLSMAPVCLVVDASSALVLRDHGSDRSGR